MLNLDEDGGLPNESFKPDSYAPNGFKGIIFFDFKVEN